MVLVSGTNGKTTTTRMVASVLENLGLKVFTNPTGSNFTRGVVSALLDRVTLGGRLDADIAVLELDEAYAVHFVRQIKPRYCLLPHVMRDPPHRSAAIDNPRLIPDAAMKFGSQCVVLAVDARRREGGGWNVFKHGGRIDTGLDALEWIDRAVRSGAGEVLLTSMDADGTKAGYDVELTRAVSDLVNVPVIASGGAGKKEHFYEVLTEGGADAALAASLFHFGELRIPDLKKYLSERGIPVRGGYHG